jgi:hypothetical protein
MMKQADIDGLIQKVYSDKDSKPCFRAEKARAALPLLIRLGQIKSQWQTAADICQLLHAAGVIEHNNPRAVGDLLGKHKGGLDLVSKIVRGKRYYMMPTLMVKQ